jgi:hypothetical protein
MEINDDFVKRDNHATAKTGGEGSTATVRHPFSVFTIPSVIPIFLRSLSKP